MAGRSYESEVVVENITKLTEKEWKEYCYQGIGGSDVVAVFGKDPESEDDGWVAKEIGKRLEELVVQIFMKKTGLRPYAVRKMFRHPDYPFMLANVDFFVEINGEIYVIECKTSFFFHMEEWEDGGIPRH